MNLSQAFGLTPVTLPDGLKTRTIGEKWEPLDEVKLTETQLSRIAKIKEFLTAQTEPMSHVEICDGTGMRKDMVYKLLRHGLNLGEWQKVMSKPKDKNNSHHRSKVALFFVES